MLLATVVESNSLRDGSEEERKVEKDIELIHNREGAGVSITAQIWASCAVVTSILPPPLPSPLTLTRCVHADT